MLLRSTWISLGVYAAVAVGHALLIATPGPPLAGTEIAALPAAPVRLVDVRRAPDGRVVATVAGAADEHWILGPPALARLAAGEPLAADAAAARAPATGAPEQLALDGAGLTWLARGPDALAAWTWSPPDPPQRHGVPVDTVWRTRDGRPIRVVDLDAAIAKTIVPGAPALVSGGWALLPVASDDDVVVAPREDPAAARVFDTGERHLFAALPRPGEFAAVHGVASRLDRVRCAQACERTYDAASASTGGPAIVALDLDPATGALAVCTAAADLLLYSFDADGEDTHLRGVARLPGPCDAALALGDDAAVGRVGDVWWRVRYTRRGGLLQ